MPNIPIPSFVQTCVQSVYMGRYLGWIWASIRGWISIPAFSLDIWVSTWVGYGGRGPYWAGYLSLHVVRRYGSLPVLDMRIHPGLAIYPCIQYGYLGLYLDWICGSILGWLSIPAFSLDIRVSTWAGYGKRGVGPSLAVCLPEVGTVVVCRTFRKWSSMPCCKL